MFLRQIYIPGLSQFSYFLESEGEAIVIDPIREPYLYLELAKERNAKIKYVLETHIHADFVSGHQEIAERSGATIIYGPNARTAYPIYMARNNEIIAFGCYSLKVLHTPGHSIESTCYMLSDESSKPLAIFTGDTLFAGDVGRPDLMSGNKSVYELTQMLYDSLSMLKTLPDDLVVYPGHGAGSDCGKNISDEKFTTIGEQKQKNYAMKVNDIDSFQQAVSRELTMPPEYFFKNMSINIMGYRPLEEVLRKNYNPLTAEEFHAELPRAIALDTRNPDVFAKSHIGGVVNIGLNGFFAPWVGKLIDMDQSVIVIADEGMEKESITRLARVGLENVRGFLSGGMEAWTAAGMPIEQMTVFSSEDFIQKHEVDKYTIVDCRKSRDFKTEHLKNTISIPLEDIQNRINEFEGGKTYLLTCKNGYQSMIAASLLKRNGIRQVAVLDGGMEAVKKITTELIESDK
jgi:glyoxylase-like metal-dependent hydrolase (beta-lactamase superfamily II)/rhodanese-related sulfurtransferase